MVDDILLKSVSGKRWVKKLCEARASILGNIDKTVLKIIDMSPAYSINNDIITLIIRSSEYLQLPSSTKTIEMVMFEMCKNSCPFNFIEVNEGNIFFHHDDEISKYKSIEFCLYTVFEIDCVNGTMDYINYILSYQKDTYTLQHYPPKYLQEKYNISGNFLDKNTLKRKPDIIKLLEQYTANKNDESVTDIPQTTFTNNNSNDVHMEVNEIKIKQKQNIKPDISDDVKAKSKIIWDVKVAGKNQLKDSNLKKAVIPEIKTKVLINDEKFRTLDNVCSMVMNNVTKLKNSLKIFNYDKNSLETLFYSDEDMDQYNFFNKLWTKKELKEQNDKYPEAVKFFSTTEQQKIQARVCYVYYEMMKMAKDGLFNKDIEYSRGLNYCLHNYLIEITSPMTILKNAITWNTLNGKQGNKVLEEVVGLNESQWEQNSYIMYPLSSTYPLADSILNMNGKILKVSTKGGLDGKGAFATLKSLREYVFEGKDGSGNITEFGKNIKNQYPDLFNIFDILTSKEWGKDITKNEWDEMYNNIRNKIGKKHIDIHKQIQEYINKDVNTSWTKMIMKILESASYDFVQVNAKATDTSGDFHFDYTAQYPAVFNGKVKIEIKDTGKAKFHIE